MNKFAFLAALSFFALPNQVSAQNACRMQGGTPIFCDTFDTKNPGIASRTGDLDPNVWGVSRLTQQTNMGQHLYNGWAATTQLQTCNGTTTVAPPNDVMICNGQLRQASNDNPTGVHDAGGVTVLAMYPKQPFDFAGRTGTVSFDVSNDTHGSHAAWPEFWFTDLPIPAPFNHSAGIGIPVPRHGFGVRFHVRAAAGEWGSCPNGNNINVPRWTVGGAVVIRNYVIDDTEFGATQISLTILDCVIAPPDNSGITNHVELRVSQNQIEVWASDAGSTALRRIAVVNNANLSLTRGLIWLEDVHYNADKAETLPPHEPSQRQHTFVWDNVAFDGPFTYRDFSFDALDNNEAASGGAVNLGKYADANQATTWNVLNMPANPQAAVVRVLFNFTNENAPAPSVLNVTVNGHPHSVPWPYPDTGPTWRTLGVTIPITDLVTGTNVVQIGSDQPQIMANVNIVLVNVPGGVPVLPGSNNAYPSSAPAPVNGVCGSANGTIASSAPTANLCAVGAASSVSGVGPWTWSCAGSNGGATASCSANKTPTSCTIITVDCGPFTFRVIPGRTNVTPTCAVDCR